MKQLACDFLEDHRPPALQAAVAELAVASELERGAVYTVPAVVDFMLDLVGYRADRDITHLRLLEPSFGGGDFLLRAIARLLDSRRTHGHPPDLDDTLIHAIRAIEINHQAFDEVSSRLGSMLITAGFEPRDADRLIAAWLVRDDFLLTPIEAPFDIVIGNPPYVRQERIDDRLLTEYRRRYATLYDRADLYVLFFERGLDLLGAGGRLAYICANRWQKNRYGGPLRAKIAADFHLETHVDMVGTEAFAGDVMTYPAITVIRRGSGRTTRVARRPPLDADHLRRLAADLTRPTPVTEHPKRENDEIHAITDVSNGRDPWLLNDLEGIALIRRLEATLPLIEDAGCKIGIGVATGADGVFIAPDEALDVEPERKLPLAMASDLDTGGIRDARRVVLNPFESDGRIAALVDYPRFARYLEAHAPVLKRRHIARRNPAHWYRTIDRIHAELTTTPKLVLPDIKGTAYVCFDEGRFYPHHNLYFITSEQWDLRALQAVLRSSLTLMVMAAYSVEMRGGFLRFQAQFLRRLRLKPWSDVSVKLRRRLIEHATIDDKAAIDEVVFDLYALTRSERQTVRAAVAS